MAWECYRTLEGPGRVIGAGPRFLPAITHREDARLPGCHVQEQPASVQIVAVPVVNGLRQLILQAPFLAAQVRERKADVALALIGGVVDGHDEAVALAALPGERQEAV